MKQSIDDRVKELKKHLDSRPSMCKHCKSNTDNGNMEYICDRTERHIFFGVKADKCYGDCELYEKDFPEKMEDMIFALLKNKINKMNSEPPKTETTENMEMWESGYLQCKNDVLMIIDELSKIRRKS